MLYIVILFWFGLLSLIVKQKKIVKMELVLNTDEIRYQKWFAAIIFLPIIFMAGFRGRVFDTGYYLTVFDQMPIHFSDLYPYVNIIVKDKGFYMVSAIFKIVFGDDAYFYLFIIALIQGVFLSSIYRKYSINYLYSVFLFVASTDYISWMFNGIRQFLAVTIIFAGTALMLRKNYISLLLLILLAATIHQTALIMIPIIFIVQGTAWNKKTLFFTLMVLMIIVFLDSFTNILEVSLTGTQYANVVSDYKSWNDDGTNPLRVFFYSIPAIFSLMGRKIIQNRDNKIINFCTNMSIITMGLYIVSIFTSGVFVGRLPIYTSLYGYILLPWELENIFKAEIKKVMYIILTIVYLVFYFVQIQMIWGLIW